MGPQGYWLMKSEPTTFSIDDLIRAPNHATYWDGIRNYQARNFMRSMAVGDQVLFYHSNTDPPAIVGIAEVVKTAYPDPTQFDKKDKHYDPESKPSEPRWDMVDIKYVRKRLPVTRRRYILAHELGHAWLDWQHRYMDDGKAST